MFTAACSLKRSDLSTPAFEEEMLNLGELEFEDGVHLYPRYEKGENSVKEVPLSVPGASRYGKKCSITYCYA